MNFFKRFPSVCILLAAALWGVTGIFVRIIENMGFDFLQLMFFRSLVTAVTVVIYLLITDRSKLKIDIRDWWYFFGTGVCSFLLFGYAYFYTICHASMSVAAILLYTAPFFVMLMAAIFFKEKITAQKVSALAIAIFGCFLICSSDTNVEITPFIIFTGLTSGFCYSLYSIFGRVALKKYSSATVTAYTFIFSTAGSIFMVNFSELPKAFAENMPALGVIVIFSIVSAVLPYIFYTNGLKYTEPGKASIMATFEAVVAAVSGIVFFHETASIAEIFGILLVLFAVAMLNLKLFNKTA